MRVSELVDHLLSLDQDLPVFMNGYEGGYHDLEEGLCGSPGPSRTGFSRTTSGTTGPTGSRRPEPRGRPRAWSSSGPNGRGGCTRPPRLLPAGTVPKHKRRLDGLSGNVISLYAKGLTTGEIQAHLEEIYDTSVSRETISKITDEIVSDMAVWQNRPLDAVYPVLLIDAIVVKVRDSQVANRPVYVAIGVDLGGERDVLGLWLGPSGGEGAKQWAAMLGELRNRGLADALIVCCDGLRGLPESIRMTWPEATVQTCVVHMVRNSLRYASKKHWGQRTKSMREIYTAPTVGVAEARFGAFAEDWEGTYPAMIRAWRNSWDEFTPFLEFPAELRRVVYTTDAIVKQGVRVFGAASGRRGPRRPALVARRGLSRRLAAL